MTRLTLTARTRLNTYANVSRKQSDKETFDMSIPGVPDEFEELMPCSARRDAEKLRGALHTLMDFAERLRTMSDEELEAWRQAAADAARGER